MSLGCRGLFRGVLKSGLGDVCGKANGVAETPGNLRTLQLNRYQVINSIFFFNEVDLFETRETTAFLVTSWSMQQKN